MSETVPFDPIDDVDDEVDVPDVMGDVVDWVGAATVLATGTFKVPMAVRTPANVASESSKVTIQEMMCFRFMPRFCAASLNRTL